MTPMFKLGVSICALIALTSTLYAGNSNKKTSKKTSEQNATKITTSEQSNSDLPQQTFSKEQFDAALKLYNENKFADGYKAFQALFDIKSDDAKINFYLGRCATELKLYDEAILAFERVISVEPTHARSRMEIARIYMEEKSFDNAEAEFKKVLEFNIPQDIKTQVNQYLAVLAGMKQKHFISGAVILGFGLDTNVKNDTGANSYTTPFNQAIQSTQLLGSKPVFDYSFSETLAANHSYKTETEGLSWVNSLVLYSQNYRQSIDSNVLFSQVASGVEYASGKYKITVTPTFENLKYGLTSTPSTDNDLLGRTTSFVSKLLTIDRLTNTMNTVGISEKFSYQINPDYSLDQSGYVKRQYFCKHGGKNNLASGGDLDATSSEFNLGVKRNFANSKSVAVSVVVDNNSKLNSWTQGPNAAYTAEALKLEYSMPVGKLFDISANGLVKKQYYRDPDITQYGFDRTDIVRSVGFTITKVFNPTTIFTLALGKTFSQSNYGADVYQKSTISTSLIKAF